MAILCFKISAISRRPSARVRNAQGQIEYIARVVPTEARSVAGAIAYQSRAAVTDPGSGKRLSYYDAHDCVLSDMILPEGAPQEWLDAQVFVEALEAAEERPDARTAMSLIMSLPRGLTLRQQKRLALRFLREAFVERGLACAWALHHGVAIDGLEQPHIHAVISTREVDPTHPAGLSPDKCSWLYARSTPKKLRHAAASAMNEALADAGVPDRVDPRSLTDQADALEAGIEEAGASLSDAEREELEAELTLLRRPAEVPTSVSGKRKEWAEAKAILSKTQDPAALKFVDPYVLDILAARKARKNFEQSIVATRKAAARAGREQTYSWLTDRFKRVEVTKKPASFFYVKDFDALDAAARKEEREAIRLQRSLKKALETGEELAKFFATIFLGEHLVNLTTSPTKPRKLSHENFKKLPVKEQVRIFHILADIHKSRSVYGDKDKIPYVWNADQNLQEIPSNGILKKRRRRTTSQEKASQEIVVQLAVRRRLEKANAKKILASTVSIDLVQKIEKRSAIRL